MRMVDQPNEDKIRERAYALWERSGRPDGQADVHWREAEAEVSSTVDAPSDQADVTTPTDEGLMVGDGSWLAPEPPAKKATGVAPVAT